MLEKLTCQLTDAKPLTDQQIGQAVERLVDETVPAAAKADFLEKEKGSLEVGKDADFVVLDQDILTVPTATLPLVRVARTCVRGERVK